MKLSPLSSLRWLLLAHCSLALAGFETCSTDEATSCQCPRIKKCAPLTRNYPEEHFPRGDDTCPDTSPPCCVEKESGGLQVSSQTSQTNLQCGSNYGDDPQDVPNGVTYTIEDCPLGPWWDQKCLRIAITPAIGVAVNDVHLQVDNDPITKNTGLGKWDFNDYCSISPAECWVPADDILGTFEDPKPTSLCNEKIYVAAGLSISGPGGDATCFNEGEVIGSGNWFMYLELDLECPEVCQRKCCCPALPTIM